MKNALQILERKVRDLKSRPTTHWVDVDTCAKLMIEFAKMHVEAALKEASTKATMNLTYPKPYEDSNESGLTYACADEISRGGEYGSVEIDENSILNAYPLTNIK